MQQTTVRANLTRRLASLVLAVGLAVAALLLLGRWAGGASAAAGLPAAPNIPAAIFNVTATTDSDDNNLADSQCHDMLNGGCSLRAALQQLDHDTGGTINLPAGTFTLTNGPDGDLTLVKNISIIAVGAGQTLIQGNPISWTHRILRVQAGAQAIVTGVTIQGGHLNGANGAGIEVLSGALTLRNVIVANNIITGGEGAGIYNSGVLHIFSSTISGNHNNFIGGGLANSAGAIATLEGSEVTSNTAYVSGAGISNLGSLIVTNSAIRHNVAGIILFDNGSGGGIANNVTGTLTISGSTLSDNTAIGFGGGGLANSGLLANIVNSTVDGNQAGIFGFSTNSPAVFFDAIGGGISNMSSTLNLSSVTVTSNTAQAVSGGGLYTNNFSVTLRNTIVALNAASGGVGTDCFGTFKSQGYNLVQSTAGCTLSGTTTGNITGLDPLLKPLANHGGPTQTRPPLVGSPAMDAGNPNGCRDSLGQLLTSDQRGGVRINGPRCDIGAVELVLRRLFLPVLYR